MTQGSTDHVRLGVALMVGFCLTAPLLDISAKLAAQTLPVGQITTARFVVQCVLMAPVCLWMGLSFSLKRSTGLLTLRAVLLILSTFFFIAAIRVMPLADALAIVFVAPFIVMLIGKFAFKEDVGRKRVTAACFGFVGVLLVVQPSFAVFGPVAFYPLGTALSFAGYILVTRGLKQRLHPVMMQFHTGLIASILCVPIIFISDGTGWALLDPAWPVGRAWIWLFGTGLFATISHMMMTYGLAFAPSATLAPIQYLEIPVATVLGFVVFSDFPNPMALCGIVIIICAGLYMIHREQALAKATATALDATSRRA